MNTLFTDISFQNMMSVANRYGLSSNAIVDLTNALMGSNGTMAQFNIPELGGGGQWMLGGMTMVGDMFNYQLKSTVDGLCVELSNLINQGNIQYKPLPKFDNESNFQNGTNGNWWGNLGFPNSTGSQNGTSYSIFSNINRLAILENGNVSIFDTLDHQIGGVGQQQGGNYSVTFTSQYGTVDLSTLPIVSNGNDNVNKEVIEEIAEESNVLEKEPEVIDKNIDLETSTIDPFQEEDIFLKIEKLADLKNKGILSKEEFDTKKSELLSRL